MCVCAAREGAFMEALKRFSYRRTLLAGSHAKSHPSRKKRAEEHTVLEIVSSEGDTVLAWGGEGEIFCLRLMLVCSSCRGI